MERACDFIERTRDPKNNLFLVGPACNLLAPSYGGVKQPDGTFGKGYLAGLSITYLAALDRMVELYKLAGDKGKLAEYERRQKITRESLPQLLTPAGYFVKSSNPAASSTACWARSSSATSKAWPTPTPWRCAWPTTQRPGRIYQQIAAFPAIRPFDFLLTNAPGLDDTYWNWGNDRGRDGRIPAVRRLGQRRRLGHGRRPRDPDATTGSASSRTFAARPSGP